MGCGSEVSRMAVHTYTNRPWSIYECIEQYAKRGISGFSVWRETIQGEDFKRVRKCITDSGMDAISLVRGGFFTGKEAGERNKKMESNLDALRECEALGIPMMVLVCGATPGQLPDENFEQILEGVGELLPKAKDAGVRLAVEPLHPMYAGDRSGISCMEDALELCAQVNDEMVGIALDVYHVWWERRLKETIKEAGRMGKLFAYHVCDYKPDMEDLLLDRGVMGEGIIRLREIDQWVMDCGFEGYREVEVFSRRWWSESQHVYLEYLIKKYGEFYVNLTRRR